MSEKRGCIFDFDDTLVETTVYYDWAKERFARQMGDFGFPGQEALNTLNQFDISNVLRCGGFLKECFPDALVQTYEYFCKKHGTEVCHDTKKWMYIVPDKTHQEYAHIAEDNSLAPQVSWIVGNSMKGDINPGLVKKCR